jgi:hypothetical protein
MLDWIERRLKQRKDAEERFEQIEKQINEVWRDIRKAIDHGVENHNSWKKIDGNVDYFDVTASDRLGSRKVTVHVDREKQTILVQRAEDSMSFKLGLGASRKIKIMHEKKAVTAAKAAEIILDPLLFPELV